MRNFLLLCLFLAFSYCGELKIASFNVENLFDGKNNGNEYPDFIVGKTGWNDAKYRQKLNKTAGVIKEINADIIGVQEVENAFVMRDLARATGYKNYEFSKPFDAPFGVGIMTNLPIKSTKKYTIANVKTRDILRADFEFEGTKFSVFVNHFLSHRNTMEKKRTEVATLKRLVKEPQNAILLGDFNTNYGYNSLLNTIIADGFTDLWDFYKGSSGSYRNGGKIDHILLSKSFKNGTLRLKDGSFGIHMAGARVSDHYPIFATLTSENSSKKPNEQESKVSQNLENSITIEQIHANKNLANSAILRNVAVVYKDKQGFAIAQNRRGIYVFGENKSLKLGDLIDIRVDQVQMYKENLEISSAQILKIHDKKANLRDFTLSENEIKNAKSGDVISQISGRVKDGEFSGKFGKIRIYSKSEKVKNGVYTFKNALVQNFRGEKELVLP